MQLRQLFSRSVAVVGIIAGFTSVAQAQQSVNVGVIVPLTGIFQSNGRQIDAAIKAFVQANGDTANGKKIEIIASVTTRARLIMRFVWLRSS